MWTVRGVMTDIMKYKAQLLIVLLVVVLLAITVIISNHQSTGKSSMVPSSEAALLQRQDGGVAGNRATSVGSSAHHSYIRLEGVDSSEHDMFLVYGGSIEQLKSICSSLSECMGFNSGGWVKSSVGNRKNQPSLDLYMKHTIEAGPQTTGTQDKDAELFTGVEDAYSSMERDLKIYIYNTKVGQDMPSFSDYKYGVEYLFISLLSKSHFRTMDPESATFFLLPIRCSAYRKSVPDLSTGVNIAANTTNKMLQDIKENLPYWNRSLGADHFYICAHDMGTDVVKRSDPNLWKNSIALVNTADVSEPMFVPYKDVSVPPHPGRGAIDWATIGQGGAEMDPSVRTTLAFMPASTGSRGSARSLVYKYYGSDSDFNLAQGHLSDEQYMKSLKTSKFCLCPRGSKAWNPVLLEALWFGCVPVIMADHYIPPLSSLVNWDQIALFTPEKQVMDLKSTLLSVSEKRLSQMQKAITEVYHHLTWHDPPRPYDAFHSVLFELWSRHNAVRSLHH